MLADPRVTVIVTTYNRAALLVQAIANVLAQNFQDFELIVADDGSTDDTEERLAAYGHRLQLIKIQHSGMPEVVRNRGLAKARGQLIAFLDDDDLWASDYLERQVALLDSDPALGFVYSDLCFLYPDGRRSGPMMSPYHKEAELLFDHLLLGCFIYPSTLMMRRNLLKKVGLMNEDIPSQGDYAFWLRLAHSAKAACNDAPLVTIRKHPANLSQRREAQDYQNAIHVLERFLQATPLSPGRRLRGRASLSRFYTHVGQNLVACGRLAEGRRSFARSLALNPAQRRAWQNLWRSYWRNAE